MSLVSEAIQNDRIKLWTNIIARSGVTETTKHALIAVDHHQRHARGAATIKDMLGITINDIRGKNRIGNRLSRWTEVSDAANSMAVKSRLRFNGDVHK